jgi:hypothetical protein
MMKNILLAIASLTLTGCLSVAPAGHVNAKSAIQRCSDRRDGQNCGNAVFNATVISQIHAGQSRADVRGIMGHNAERLEISNLSESWGYMTSYKNQMITWITFTDRQVSSLSHEQLRHD